jgi:HD-GYP domain-containing protein (c-di-GMP phosphodiesterase class II)
LAEANDATVVARRLAREFGAPVGLFDPTRGGWRVRLGADPERFPRGDMQLPAALASSGVGPGRAGVCRLDRRGGPVWLGLPVPALDGEDLVALAGFAASSEAAEADAWGPSCPEPALRAWGQAVADQLRGEKDAQAFCHGSSARPEGGERVLIARLIRRLKISDAPERFQALATGALRAALGVAATAWVPDNPHEPVIVSGEVPGLAANGYRAVVPPTRHEPAFIDNQPKTSLEVTPRRIAAVAADSHAATGWLVAANPRDGRPFAFAELEVLGPVASLIATQQTNARLYSDLNGLLVGVIRALTAAIDAKDPYTSGHSERVARIAVRLAEELGMSANQRSDLYLMGLLHDVGKIGIGDSVLKKTGPLTPEEYRLIQSHVEIGVHILTDLKKLHHLLPGIRHHHERLDGNGYPSGLARDVIPLEARILAVADSFDAMSSTRPYRRRLTTMQIDEILRKGSGTQWDPKVVDALFACRMDIEHIRQKGLGESLQLVVNDTLGRT